MRVGRREWKGARKDLHTNRSNNTVQGIQSIASKERAYTTAFEISGEVRESVEEND